MSGQFFGMVQGRRVTLPFKFQPGDEITLDLKTHCWKATYTKDLPSKQLGGNLGRISGLPAGRVCYFASYKRAVSDLQFFGGGALEQIRDSVDGDWVITREIVEAVMVH